MHYCNCKGLYLLSQIITKSGYGYNFKSGATSSACMTSSCDSLIHLTRIYSDAIGMSFELKKCGRMIARRGKVIKVADGLELPADHIADIQTSYKYLGIPQSHDEEARKTETARYHRRVRRS